MISKIISPLCRTVTRTNVVTRKAHHVAKAETPLMDLAPVPEGSWNEYYKKQNAKYNMHMIGGILFFLISASYAHYGGYTFVNAFTPPLPTEEQLQKWKEEREQESDD